MTVEQRVYDISLDAAADLSASQFLIARVSGEFQANLATAAHAAALGPIQNKPESGQATEIRVVGISKVLCGGTIAVGANVTSNASGQGVTAASGERYIGKALEPGVNGRVISILCERGYAP